MARQVTVPYAVTDAYEKTCVIDLEDLTQEIISLDLVSLAQSDSLPRMQSTLSYKKEEIIIPPKKATISAKTGHGATPPGVMARFKSKRLGEERRINFRNYLPNGTRSTHLSITIHTLMAQTSTV